MQPSLSLIVVLVSRLVAPLIQVFACYVIFHGHYSPGGGFQGGALLAASVLLLRLSSGRKGSQRNFRSDLSLILGPLGAIAFLAVGLIMMGGGSFLDYQHIPLLRLEPAEVAIGLAVMGALISIFDNLVGSGGDGNR